MSIESLELEALFTELRQLANDAGAGSLAKTASEASEGEGEAALERRVAQLVLLSTALRAGIEACQASADLPAAEVESKISILRAATTENNEFTALVERELERLQHKLSADVQAFKRDLALELPLALREASLDELKRHFVAFTEHTFQRWAQAELGEVEAELGALSARVNALLGEGSAPLLRPWVLPEFGARALELDTFRRDLGVFALSTVGIAALFSNVLLGGTLLVAAPLLARVGRERSLVELKARASEEAVRALGEAAERLEVELSRRIKSFRDELVRVAAGPEAPARRGVAEMLERALAERSNGVEAPTVLERCRSWQERLTALVARAQALSPGARFERIRS